MPATPARYYERLAVPASWWLLGAGFTLAVGWAFFVATPLAATVVATAVTGVLVALGLVRYGGIVVAVDQDGLTAGRAHLPWPCVGAATPLDPAATRAVLGREADARAYLMTRAYCRSAVKVMVEDASDPTPYWVVSTRRPQALATRLNQRVVQG